MSKAIYKKIAVETGRTLENVLIEEINDLLDFVGESVLCQSGVKYHTSQFAFIELLQTENMILQKKITSLERRT